jgi:hypothetical protein
VNAFYVECGVARPVHHAVADRYGYIDPVGHYRLCYRTNRNRRAPVCEAASVSVTPAA